MSDTAKNPLNSLIESLFSSKKTILLIVGFAAITLSLSIIIPIMLDATTHLSFPSIGTIHTIGVKAYYDADLQNLTTQIRWGTTYPGSSTNVTLYLKSISNTKTKLQLQTANWTFYNSTNAALSGPSGTSPYLNLTWNYNDTAIDPSRTIIVTLTLYVTDSQTFTQFLVNNHLTSFSFDIIIFATEEID